MDEGQQSKIERMADDIASIKTSLERAATIVEFIQKAQETIATRVAKIEETQALCPARLRAQSYSIAANDFLKWIILFASIGSVILWLKSKGLL